MKKTLVMVALAISIQGLYAQIDDEKTLFERVSETEKKIEWFNLYLNMRGSFNAYFNGSEEKGLEEASFNMEQFRIEAKGNVTPWLSYRWRQRLNRTNEVGSNIDNMPTSIDYAGIGVRLNNKFSVFMGKQCAAYGGIEFDLNPIDVFEYSNMAANSSNFMTGVMLAFQPVANHQIQLQILNSRNGSDEETYGDLRASGIESTRAPLVYTANWNGGLFNNVLKTRWSASVLTEAKDKNMYYLAFGNDFSLNKLNAYFDVLYSVEDIDRRGLVTTMQGGRAALNGLNALDTEYLSLIARFNYRFAPRWNAFAKGMYETASVSKERELTGKGKYSTSYGYIGGVEYYPMADSNLRFFAVVVGRSFRFTQLGGMDNYNTAQVSCGFIYQLPMF